MVRDIDLVRELLLIVEKKKPQMLKGVAWIGGPDTKLGPMPTVEGRSEDEVAYHLVLLYQAGLLQGEPMTSKTSDRVIALAAVGDLTWEGYEFVEKIRSQSTWRKTREIARQATGAVAMQTLLWAAAQGRKGVGSRLYFWCLS